MKKLLTFLVSSSLIGACSLPGSKKKEKTKSTSSKAETNTSTQTASKHFIVSNKKDMLAFATQDGALELSEPQTNPVASQLYRSAIKYDYNLPKFPKSFESTEARSVYTKSFNNYHSIRATSGNDNKKADQVAIDILKKMQNNDVDIAIIETSPSSDDADKAIINTPKFQDFVKSDSFTKKLILVGENTSHVDLGNDKKGSAWEGTKNVATFEFSKITTAYNTGYLTQTQFGKLRKKDGSFETKSVGYLVAAVKSDTKKVNTLQMKKANAFRKGVMDAIKEQKTGSATFVKKSSGSDISKEQTLMIDSTIDKDVKKYFKNWLKEEDYYDKDHSFVYFVGASPDDNKKAADEIIKRSVTNKYGHKLIVERASDTKVKFREDNNEKSNTLHYAFPETNSYGTGRKKIVGRVFMSSKSWVDVKKEDTKAIDDNFGSSWFEAKKSAKALMIEAALSGMYGENKGKVEYFGKHTYIGAFPAFARVKVYDVDENAQKIDDLVLDEVRKTLFAKNIKIEDISDEFLGSGI